MPSPAGLPQPESPGLPALVFDENGPHNPAAIGECPQVGFAENAPALLEQGERLLLAGSEGREEAEYLPRRVKARPEGSLRAVGQLDQEIVGALQLAVVQGRG